MFNKEFYTSLLAISGFVISPLMALFVSLLTEKRKNKAELRKMMLNKKLEAAETFLKEYAYYLDSIRKYSYAQRRKTSVLGSKSRKYLTDSINRCLKDMVEFSENKRADLAKVLLYYGIEDSFLVADENIKYMDLVTAIFDLEELADDNCPETVADYKNAILALCDWFDDFADKRKGHIDKIQKIIHHELKDEPRTILESIF